MVNAWLVMEPKRNLQLIFGRFNKFLNHLILLSTMKVTALQNMEVFHLKYILITHAYGSLHMCVQHMVTILNFISYGLPKFSPSHLYKEETFHPYKSKLYFGKLSKFPKKEKIFCDGPIKLVNCQKKRKKQIMNLGNISLIKKKKKLMV